MMVIRGSQAVQGGISGRANNLDRWVSKQCANSVPAARKPAGHSATDQSTPLR